MATPSIAAATATTEPSWEQSKPWYFEVEREFAPSQDWSVSGVDTLVLYVHGRVANDPVPLYVTVKGNTGKAVTTVYADAEVTRAEEWIEWKIPLNQFVGVNFARVKRVYLGVGDRMNPAPAGFISTIFG